MEHKYNKKIIYFNRDKITDKGSPYMRRGVDPLYGICHQLWFIWKYLLRKYNQFKKEK